MPNFLNYHRFVGNESFARCRRPAVIGLVLLFGFFYFQNLHRIIDQHHQADFKHFYWATVAMSHGEDPYLSGTRGYVYPPLLAFLYLPLAHLSDVGAAAVALTINVPLMLLSLLIGASEASRRMIAPQAKILGHHPPDSGFVPLVAMVAAAITFGRLKAELQMLQTDVLVLVMYALALLWLDRRPILAGAGLGFAMNIKYYTAPALLYLLLRRRWAASTSFIVSAVFFAILPAAKVGLQTELGYLSIASGGVLKSVGVETPQQETARVHGVYDALSVSVTSGIARAVRHTHPSAAAPLTAGVIVISVLLAGWWYRQYHMPFLLWPDAAAQRHRPFRELILLEWVGVMIASIAFSPDSNMRHMVLILLANCVAVALLLSPRTDLPKIPILCGLILEVLAFDSPGKWPESPRNTFFKFGGHGWCILVFYATVLWTGLRSMSAPPVMEPARLAEAAA